jgi:hypothetical protein
VVTAARSGGRLDVLLAREGGRVRVSQGAGTGRGDLDPPAGSKHQSGGGVNWAAAPRK